MILQFRHLKHFIDRKSVDHVMIMKEVLNFEAKGLLKFFRFRRAFKEADLLIKQIVRIDPSKLELPKYSNFLIPPSIDYIPFIARMELEAQLTNLGNGDTIDEIATIVATVCYHQTRNRDFDSETNDFRRFKEVILNSSIESVMGVFNWIKTSIKESQKYWEEQFRPVNTVDPDYLQAGGHMMERFNVINSVKMVCSDFNLDYYRAWQIPYLIVQTNALESATKSTIQDRMSKIKEKKMRQERAVKR